MTTRSLEDLELAARLVHEVAGAHAEGSKVRKIYGGLCHTFPILVMQCGLAQAIAFHTDKASGTSERATAHRLLLEHHRIVLGDLDLAQLPLGQYIQAARRTLAAWVFFKRFAVSVLRVRAGEESDE